MMSMICEHPLCTRLISTKCSNHCQLDLCQDHLIEHKNLFLVQYEKSVNNLNKTIKELINSFEEKKVNLNKNYEKDILLINENYNNKLNEFQQKSSFIFSTQNLIKKKLQLLNDIKNGQALLYQYDIEQIKLYLTKIREYHHEKMIISEPDENDTETSLSSSTSDTNSDEDYYQEPKTKTTRQDLMAFRGECPLTRLGIYGLNNKHNLRLCSSKTNTSNHYLVKHFHHYHHLTISISYDLTKAIINKLNPLTTCIFKSERKIIDKRFYVIKCPLKQMKLSDCKKKFFKDSLKTHLLNVHHLTSETTDKIIDTVNNQGDLKQLEVNEDEFK